MRRVIALILMYLVPLQYTWAAASLHVHPEEAATGEFLHIGDHVPPAAGDADGEHGKHCQHVPSLLILDSGQPVGIEPAGALALPPPASHSSHIPPVRDRPPRCGA